MDSNPIIHQVIGRRIKVLRESKDLNQHDLARLLGFKDRQTVSAIETGIRKITADELTLVIEKLGEPFEYFVDTYRLVDEGRFSWRKENVDGRRLAAYEHKAGRWIATYRNLIQRIGREPFLLRQALGLDSNSTREDARQAGERMVGKFAFGDVPALQLRDVMEKKFGILTLMVDAEAGISGAACRLPDLDAVLVARHKPAGRRYFTLAHEFFHLLTWDAMPPEHAEEDREMAGNRMEKLADIFAAAVLMPKAMLEPFGPWSKLDKSELVSRLNAIAPELHVTPAALMWRLVSLGELKQSVARALPADALRDSGPDVDAEESLPLLFSKRYMQVIGQGIRKGLISVRLLTRVHNMTTEDLSDLFRSHGLRSPIGL